MRLYLMLFVVVLEFGFSKDIQVAYAKTTPPYVFEDGSGILCDIISKSLEVTGNSVTPVFINIGRGYEMFKNKKIDALSITKKVAEVNTFYSDYMIMYQNAAYSLSKNSINIKNISDLSSYNVVSFQNAYKYLGEEFRNAVDKNSGQYSEIANQKQQVYLLLLGRIEVAVLEKKIFEYYKDLLIEEKLIDKNIKYTLHNIFKPTYYRTAFNDSKVRDDFNKGLKEIKKQSVYENIYKKYNSKAISNEI